MPWTDFFLSLISLFDIFCSGIAEAILASLVPWQEKYDLDTVLQHSTFDATLFFFASVFIRRVLILVC
jgi:hypothetical protein